MIFLIETVHYPFHTSRVTCHSRVKGQFAIFEHLFNKIAIINIIFERNLTARFWHDNYSMLTQFILSRAMASSHILTSKLYMLGLATANSLTP
jgi:hypothetical protein